jgi:hypothetical protein
MLAQSGVEFIAVDNTPQSVRHMPRVLSREEWIEKYSPKQDGESK